MSLGAILSIFLSAPAAHAQIANWNSQINLSEARVQYVVETSEHLEFEAMTELLKCELLPIYLFELTDSSFDQGQVQFFSIQSEASLSGPQCPSQFYSCATQFKYLGPLDWDVKTLCRTTEPSKTKGMSKWLSN